MNHKTRASLNGINARFYSSQSQDFSATRRRPWPGWHRVLEQVDAETGAIPTPLRVLDVGCGNGRFAAFLAEHRSGAVLYEGLDSSRALLEQARAQEALPARWHHCDIVDPGGPALPGGPFDLVVVFGVLHHVPGLASRRRLIEDLLARVDPAGALVLTVWQFADRARFRRRILPWAQFVDEAPTVSLDVGQLETGDHLLRWGAGPTTVRYCHHTSDAEVETLVAGLAADRVDDFRADGEAGDLNRYLVLRPRAGPALIGSEK